MRNRNAKGLGYFILVLLAGAIIGGVVGDILSAYWPIFESKWVIGITEPIMLDLYLIKLVFGVTLKLNIGSIVGMLMALIGYLR